MNNYIQKDSKIFVAGHRGLAGSAIVRKLRTIGYKNLLLRTRQEVDLQDSNAVSRFFDEQRPEFVFLPLPKWEAFSPIATSLPTSSHRTTHPE